ncbi:MAG: hypothetical protein ACK4QW_15830 [Alphaproteobacteria bacterium]
MSRSEHRTGEDETAGRPASPVCFMDEADDRYAGYLGHAEIADLLGDLAARVEIAALATEAGDGAPGALWADLARMLAPVLPRIRDERLHAALARLAGAGSR